MEDLQSPEKIRLVGWADTNMTGRTLDEMKSAGITPENKSNPSLFFDLQTDSNQDN